MYKRARGLRHAACARFVCDFLFFTRKCADVCRRDVLDDHGHERVRFVSGRYVLGRLRRKQRGRVRFVSCEYDLAGRELVGQ